MSSKEKDPVIVTLPPGTSGNLSAYVVAKDGSLLDTAPFSEGKARLSLSKDTLKGTRVFVGPPFPKEYPASRINAYSLATSGAQQISVNFTAANEIAIVHLPAFIIPPLHSCDIVGNVTNTLTVNGLPQSGPLCKARVHICTVDWFFRWPIWLRPVVPENVLNELKDKFAALATSPIPPAPDPGPLAAKVNLPLRSLSARTSNALKPLPTTIQDAIQSATTDTIHEVVFNHAEILYPYFCIWPIFWFWFYRVTEVETVYTDCNGHFNGLLLSFAPLPAENIYVWVEANIGGTWTTVYRPPFPCHTYWDYACNTDIDINLSNPNIPPCNCDVTVNDGTAWFTAIGSQAIASGIQQDPTYTNAYGIETLGCSNVFNADQLNPFGATLDLGLAFGSMLPPASYYRWKYTLAYDSTLKALSGEPTQYIMPTIARPYLWQKPDGSWQSGSINLTATDSGGNTAYSIPNFNVTSYPGVPSTAEWVSFNFVSSYFDSTAIPSGCIIRLELELLNMSGGLFEVVPVPPSTYQVSINTDPSTGYGGSVPAPSPYLNLDGSGNALSLSFLVRVDNSPVTATINNVVLESSPAVTSNTCGYLPFPNNPTGLGYGTILGFQASEAFNFAKYGFGVVRGNGSGEPVAAGGYVFENYTDPGGHYTFTESSGTFTSSGLTVGYLMGTCTQAAAFAESLTVTHLATDGTSELWQTYGEPYYASYLAAFALIGS
ncbi:hypothetical protein [Dinghuibacter silviterrae]|uniref:Uncharacterized protein n=1 Tax=Dinghuibacter silviterrae TaxID=1539049 RepID=A0A4R8DPL9_9BACT|nr:hypothetical protein [Dinghuibacter silviterrae]TDW99236.1 hypothetical protein EDB95_0245 [Dinghuibacter silviterrae]